MRVIDLSELQEPSTEEASENSAKFYRTVFLAFIKEGFTNEQAFELTRQVLIKSFEE